MIGQKLILLVKKTKATYLLTVLLGKCQTTTVFSDAENKSFVLFQAKQEILVEWPP